MHHFGILMCYKEIPIQLGPERYQTNFHPISKSSRGCSRDKNFTKEHTKENIAVWFFGPYSIKLKEIPNLMYLGQFV